MPGRLMSGADPEDATEPSFPAEESSRSSAQTLRMRETRRIQRAAGTPSARISASAKESRSVEGAGRLPAVPSRSHQSHAAAAEHSSEGAIERMKSFAPPELRLSL